MNERQQTSRFACPGCGGQKVFCPEHQNLKCNHCGNLTDIENTGEGIIEYELDAAEEESMFDWGTHTRVIHCGSCGGTTVLDTYQTAAFCTFCGSSHVAEHQEGAGIHPESIIPFQVSEEKALAEFRAWKKSRWFVPNDFKKNKLAHELKGIYVPYWTYDSDTASTYTAEAGTHRYRTVTRTRTVNGKPQVYTQQVRYTDWRPTSGSYSKFFDDVLIHASRQFDPNVLDRIGSFGLDRLAAYKPEYISGFAAERYSINLQQGWDKARQRIAQQLQQDIKRSIRADEVRNLRVNTIHSRVKYKHMLLPVWSASYAYGGKRYIYLVNGQTGRVHGQAPRSAAKITAFTAAIVLLLAVLFLFVFQSA